MKLPKMYQDVFDNLEWSYDCGTYSDGKGYVELEKYTPAGEDFLLCLPIENMADEAADYYNDFDEEEHVTELLIAKQNGFQGVPNLWVLVDDAKEISDMLECLADELYNAELKNDEEEDEEVDDLL